MRRASTSYSHSRPRSGRKTMRRCRQKEQADNVILIDVDSDHLENVIIIDTPDSFSKKHQGSTILGKDKKRPSQTVICIDDDEIPGNFHSVAGASSSRGFMPTTEHFEVIDAAENPFTLENATPVRLSKCKRTYSGKASTGNGYGLNVASENNSSANDHPDCELMEDISGRVQEQWEKAFCRRKKGNNNGRSGMRCQNGPSRIINDNYHQSFGRKDVNDGHMETPSYFHAGNFSNEDEGPPFSKEEDAHDSSNYVPLGDSSSRGQHSPYSRAEQEDHLHVEPGNSSCQNGRRSNHPSSNSSDFEPAMKESKKTKSFVDGNFSYGKASSVINDVAINKSQNPYEVEIEPAIFVPTSEFRESLVASAGCVNEMEHLESCELYPPGGVPKTYTLSSERSSFMSSTLPERQTNISSTPSDAVDSVSGKSIFHNTSQESRDGINNGCHQENRQRGNKIPISRNIHAQINEATVRLTESVSCSGSEEDKDDEWHVENGETLNPLENSVIGEREKLKESAEYKRAVEEEWASRQQALKIQAEEAQHLRRLQRRRKAESLRLLDMERRQKERIEEMRITQKKDEENMNLKEVIRAEVRQELCQLEMACPDMASLLHSLGIRIEGWPNPLPQEVQMAYKRALLTFHPDRASRGDVRQQVEAEEKFKLMNRFKEKFSLVL